MINPMGEARYEAVRQELATLSDMVNQPNEPKVGDKFRCVGTEEQLRQCCVAYFVAGQVGTLFNKDDSDTWTYRFDCPPVTGGYTPFIPNKYMVPVTNEEQGITSPMDVTNIQAFGSGGISVNNIDTTKKFVVVSTGAGGSYQSEISSRVGLQAKFLYDAGTNAMFRFNDGVELFIYWSNMGYWPETSGSATKVITREALAKVTVPDHVKDEIVSVVRQHQRKDVLLNQWGLGEVIEYGLGMNLLLWGPPGVGKTYVAKKIAEALGLKLTMVTNAELQSSQPGQFERNVKALFEKAKRDKDILLFDECDGMVQSRDGMGQIMSSENNCLLTEIEKHDGIVFLTTNRIDTLDAALERRISLIIEFKMPDQTERKQIWDLHIPTKLPLDEDVSVDKLSEWALSGGQIKNCVLNAARFALGEDKDKVSMCHFDRAVKRVQEGSKAFAGRRRTAYNLVADAMNGGDKARDTVRQPDMGVSKRK